MISFNVQGVRTFNGDGTGRVVGLSVNLGHPFALPTSPAVFNRGGASSIDFEADFTYQVAPDGTFTVAQGPVTGTVLTGTRKDQTFTLDSVPLSGLISQDHRTLTTATNEPNIETVTFSNGDVQPRICHRSRILLQLKGGNY